MSFVADLEQEEVVVAYQQPTVIVNSKIAFVVLLKNLLLPLAGALGDNPVGTIELRIADSTADIKKIKKLVEIFSFLVNEAL